MNRDKIAATWRHYLGSGPASPYAAPARAADLSGLPPAYIATAEVDPLRDEGIDYALRMLQAGVSVELHQWPGTFPDRSVGTVAMTGVRPAKRLSSKSSGWGDGCDRVAGLSQLNQVLARVAARRGFGARLAWGRRDQPGGAGKRDAADRRPPVSALSA